MRTFIGFDDCVGYNSSLGGEGVHSVNIEYNWISQFSPDGKLIKVHNSLRGAEAATGISRVGIANACDGKAISCGGFLWRRYRDTDASLIAPEVIGTERVIRSVTKFSLDGTRLESYKSLKDAANASNCNSSVIAKVCSGKLKSTGGFQWRYGIIAGDIEPLSREKSKSRQVQMLDLGGNVIGTYSSIREAAEQNGISVSYVSTAIQNGRAVMGRYFKALNNFRHTRGVIQVDLSGREVARY